MSAAQAIELAHRHGVELEPRGELLHYRAAAQPPPEVLEALRQHKSEIMSALATASPGAPQDWLEGVSRLRGMSTPETVAPDSWAAFLASCESFIASPWPGKAASMGWDAYALFGCHNLKPVERVDRMGLLWLLRGGRVAALTSESAVIEMPSGSRLTYRVKHTRNPGDVLAWELVPENPYIEGIA